ncbi:MAG: DUF899 family protein [Planctomycetota bacterium]
MNRHEEISALQREVMEKQARLNELLRESGRAEIADHRLVEASGEVRLSELFGDRSDLIVIHNMGKGCPYCTLWADGLNGMLPHFESRSAIALVSPDEPEEQRAFAESRGWKFRMVSDRARSFTQDCGFVANHEGREMVMPGFSTFTRDGDRIERVASSFFGPGDTYCAAWHMLALLADGVNEWQPRFDYS